ncbi:hypothetical protein E1293_42550 [Actinomadura darangshiensis]|uniref:Uncharacterized protein n=1 Tax=Actinomadura darangshiensis TaxID=705336 RepID=A0A4R4ZXL7_9ACTN|nr:hypothetical protein E1293_42550 [Actinomadura darangshiensis]
MNTVIARRRTHSAASGSAQRRSAGIRRQTVTTSPSQSCCHRRDEPRGLRHRSSIAATTRVRIDAVTRPPISTMVHVLQRESCAPLMTADHSKIRVSPISVVIAPAARSVCCRRSGPPGIRQAGSRRRMTSASIGTVN